MNGAWHRWRRRLPLSLVFSALALAYMGAAAGLAVLLSAWIAHRGWAAVIAVTLLLPLLVYQVRRMLAPMHSLFRALAGTVASYRDGDYGFSLSTGVDGELGELVAAHNRLGDALREQRLALVPQHRPQPVVRVDQFAQRAAAVP